MKALIAMSGGVDSSVAAYLMNKAGFECAGCTMKLYTNADAAVPSSRTCCSLDDVEDARSVATRLNMPYYVFNFSDEFRKQVIGKFINCYLCGITPNPCIDCNRFMKFDRLLERALLLGYDTVATGHYARVAFDGSRYHLLCGLDAAKDQSYVLYSLTQPQLAHIRFPLGGLTKEETRRIAAENGFLNAEKPDSQDICFVPDGDYGAVIKAHRPDAAAPGNFVDRDGNILGTHRGILYYTIGQRRGLGLSLPAPLYVRELRPETNEVVLGPNEALFSETAFAADMNWISGEAPKETFACEVKIRYRQPATKALVTPQADGSIRLAFETPQRAVTPGQAAVLYQGDEVLGGGTILAQLSDR